MTESVPTTWASNFAAFTTFHGVTVAVCAAVVLAVCALSVFTGQEKRVRKIWCVTVIGWQAFSVVFWWAIRDFNMGESLPLHLCDLAGWVAPFALLTQKRWLRSLLYFWGIGLSTQAFITPIQHEGYAHMTYWAFFVGHTQIVGSAFYDLIILRYRPRFRDVIVGTSITFALMCAILLFNVLMETNYWYVGQEAATGTVVEKLGPWPGRVGVMSGIVITVFVLMWAIWLPFGKSKRNGIGKPDEDAASEVVTP